MKETDVLVIGSGIAGLSFAIKIAEARPDLSLLIITKSNHEESNTSHAQGGIAVVLDKLKDSYQQHIIDTLQAGKGLCDKNVVEMVVHQAPERLQELIAWGASFDVEKNGQFALGLEGGHSQHRIVHHKDLTGFEIEKSLLKKVESLPNIKIYDHFFVTDLILDDENHYHKCTGGYVFDKQKNEHISVQARITFLASGGSGRIFTNTTNPHVATGDGVAMAYRAGAEIKNMQFFQFHPTALYEKGKQPLFLISEAVRGFGAHLVNRQGKRFVFKYDERGELATRDIVSEAIFSELKTSGDECVYLDCRHLEEERFKEHFPNIVARCASLGFDITTDLIPVVPAAHYQCGGIVVDTHARTNIGNLYASGECTHTGLHGANRLASNSLLEALVYSHQASTTVLAEIDKIKLPTKRRKIYFFQNEKSDDAPLVIHRIRERFKALMTYKLIYAEGTHRKEAALRELYLLDSKIRKNCRSITHNIEFFELKNMIEVACLVVEHSLENQLETELSQIA